MYVQTKPKQLNGWLDTVGQVIGAVASERASSRSSANARSDAAVRIAEANANVEAQRLALQAEALRAGQKKPDSNVLTSTPVLLGGAGVLAGLLYWMVSKRRKGSRGR